MYETCWVAFEWNTVIGEEANSRNAIHGFATHRKCDIIIGEQRYILFLSPLNATKSYKLGL